jgi:hypothetical protein
MLCLAGLGCKDYWERLGEGQALPELACPDPSCEGSLLRGHGWYRRYLGGVPVNIRRLCCRGCGVTHALLPEDVVAYHDLTLLDLEEIVKAEGGPGAAARASHQKGPTGVRRVRRWRHTLRCEDSGSELLALLPAAVGPWWDRARLTLGQAPGVLIRLRHWLWSTYLYFFSGLTGLYRHGRPRAPDRGHSTEGGSCPRS